MDELDTIKKFTKKVFWIAYIGESFGAMGLILGKKQLEVRNENVKN